MNIKFSKKELWLLVLTAFVAAFSLTFDKWGIETFDVVAGLNNLGIAVLIVAASLYIKLAVQKYSSGKVGYNAEFKPWVIGFIIALFLIFVTNGKFIFLAFGGLIFTIVEKLKIGKGKTNLSPVLMGWLSVLGPLTHIALALTAKILLSGFTSSLLEGIVTINIWLAFYSILPIPFVHKFTIGRKKEFGTSDGLKMLFASPMQYFVVAILVIIDVLVISLSTAQNAFITTAISFMVILLTYYLFYRQHLRKEAHGIYKYRFD